MDIQVSGNAHSSYPCDTVYGLLWVDDEKSYAFPKQVPYCGEWGEALTNVISLDPMDTLPVKLSVLWLSLYEEKYYKLDESLDRAALTLALKDCEDATHIVVGMAPFGLCALWINGPMKSILIDCFKGEDFDADFSDLDVYSTGLSFSQYCALLSSRNDDLMTQKKLRPDLSLKYFKSLMAQYLYRYTVLFGRWEDGKWVDGQSEKVVSKLAWIHVKRFDGTYCKYDERLLTQYHSGGIPKKLDISWSNGKSEISAYFMMEVDDITEIFNRFYGAHPDTKTDFIIHIDAKNKKYELGLYRQGLKEPVIIPETAYQLIVFRNKFEEYRSENYNQPRGAWIW